MFIIYSQLIMNETILITYQNTLKLAFKLRILITIIMISFFPSKYANGYSSISYNIFYSFEILDSQGIDSEFVWINYIAHNTLLGDGKDSFHTLEELIYEIQRLSYAHREMKTLLKKLTSLLWLLLAKITIKMKNQLLLSYIVLSSEEKNIPNE